MPRGHYLAEAVKDAIWVLRAEGVSEAEIGRQLDNPVLGTEARITLIDGALATVVLVGVVLNAAAGWWRADPAAALVLVFCDVREAHHAWHEARALDGPSAAPSVLGE